MLQTEDHVVENATWLRSADDSRHINVAELESAIKALGLTASKQVHKVSLMTDSKTAAGWLQCIAGNTRRVKVGGLHEVLVKRRLKVVKDPYPDDRHGSRSLVGPVSRHLNEIRCTESGQKRQWV